METTARPAPPNKGDIINRLIRQFGLKRYLEYNKFDGATYYDDIVCEHKEVAYLPERSLLDADNLQRLLEAAKDAALDAILPLDKLLERHRGNRFDIIFFDPVHVRPEVDQALQVLPRLLNPGGFLVVHDCNPGHFSQTTLQRKPQSWVGETYKAFTVLRAHNRERAITVDEDFGVGLVWNVDLDLDYSTDFDVDYFAFAERRQEYIGLLGYDEFLDRTADGDAARLFAQAPARETVQLLALAPDGPVARSQSPGAPPAAVVSRRAQGQLFWRGAGAAFAERSSCEWPISFDGKRQHLRFLITDLDAPVAQLRLDFADSLGAAWLDSLVLKDSQAQEQWRWDGRPGSFKDVANLVLLETPAPARQLFLLATSADPHFDPAPPAEVLERLRSGWAFEVELVPLPDFMLGLLSELAAGRAAAGALQRREAALLARLEALERRVGDGVGGRGEP
ncbi:MAG: class I SAM-dependent methyltransferase [Burkholderiaceae bacterium]